MSASGSGADARVRDVWILIPDEAETSPASGADAVRAFGLSAVERLSRAIERAGAEPRVVRAGVTPEIAGARGAAIRGDYFYDERLIEGLLAGPNVLLHSAEPDDPAARAVAAIASASGLVAALPGLESAGAIPEQRGQTIPDLPRVAPLDVAPAYNAALRKFDPPFVFPASAEEVRRTERRIFASSYKGVTDLVTKWVFPLPARVVTRWLAGHGVKPNTVTAVSYVLVALVTWLFAIGWFGTGLFLAWWMTFLDTVDGKLARVTLTSTRFGNVLDHGLDLVHPPIWWWAFGVGLERVSPGSSALAWALWVIVGGYFMGRALEGIFLFAFKQEIFTWRPFDAFFRTVIARRNPNLLLLTGGLLAARPDLGYVAVAVWTLVCLLVHSVRIVQAWVLVRDGGVIRPWFEERGQGMGATGNGESLHAKTA